MVDLRSLLLTIAVDDSWRATRSFDGEIRNDTWAALTDAAARHRLLPSLASAWSDIDSYRGTLARRLIVGFRAVDEQRREQSAELLSALDSADVRFSVLKGNAVAEICYSATWLREFNDLDVLVDGPDLERAATALRQLGYSQREHLTTTSLGPALSNARVKGYTEELQHLAEFVRPGRLRVDKVDLHHRVSTVFDHIKVPASPLLDALLDETGKSTALAVHLCYHAWWDANGVEQNMRDRALRLSQFADIERLLRSGRTSVSAMQDMAVRLGCPGPVAFALRVCRDLWGNHVISDEWDRLGMELDRSFSDRWVTRDSEVTLWNWSSDASERMFDPTIPDLTARLFFTNYVQGHLKQGDVLTWSLRNETAG